MHNKGLLNLVISIMFIGIIINPSSGHIPTKNKLLDTSQLMFEPNEPPIADAGGPYFEYIENEVFFNGSESYDPDGTIVSYEWDFGDLTNGSGETTTHQYSFPGEYIVDLTVTDNNGAVDNDNTTAYIYSSRPLPRPTIEGPRFGKVKVEYNFTLNSFNPDCDNVLYIIDWDDGSSTGWIGPYEPGWEINVNKTYQKIGLYTIRAKVKTIFNYESDWTQFYFIVYRTRNAKEFVYNNYFFERSPILERLMVLIK